MKKDWSVSSAMLHVLGMIFMLCDHSWHALFSTQRWLTGIGRIAFPIFAFMLVEGFFYTKNRKKYMLRMLVFALVSEVPFDLLLEGTWMYPFHQNVMWTFLLSMIMLCGIEKVKEKNKRWLTIVASAGIVLAGFLLGMITFVDYYGFGVLMVFTFYFFRERKWWCALGQLICLYFINVEMLGGMYYPVNLFGMELEIVEQGLALLALVPIWLYRGKQGYHAKWFQYFCYAFYPGHLLMLYVIGLLTM